MPGYKVSKKKWVVRKRKTNRKSKYTNGKSNTIPKTKQNDITTELFAQRQGWLPQRLYKYLTMSRQSAMQTSTTQSVFGDEHRFRLNSIFQPMAHPVGTLAQRVVAFNQIAAQYTDYQVKGVKIELEFSNPSADGLYVGVGITTSGDSQPIEANTVTHTEARRGFICIPINNTGSQVIRKSIYISIAQLEGISKSNMSVKTAEYAALITSNPSSVPMLRIAVANTQDALNRTVVYKLKLSYLTELSGRVTDSQPDYTT